MEASFLRSGEKITKTRNRLPHWEQDGRSYFVSFHLADSIPRPVSRKWKHEREVWLAAHPEPWSSVDHREYRALFSSSREKWLDESHGTCLLRDGPSRDRVWDCLRKFDDSRYWIWSSVLMPNHVHILVTLFPGQRLARIVQCWKGASSRRLRELVPRAPALIWQKDYFDRLIRDGSHFWQVASYIRRNPAKARLARSEYTLYEHTEVKAVLG